MLEQTKRISFGISSVLSKVEREPDLNTGSDQKVPATAPQHCPGLDFFLFLPVANIASTNLSCQTNYRTRRTAGAPSRSRSGEPWGS